MITGPRIKYDAGDRGSLDASIMYRFGGLTQTNYTNKIYTYINNTLKLMSNSPKIMVGSTLKNIKAIWVGNKEVFGSYDVTDGGLLVNYMYYINGSWRSTLSIESIADAKSYTLYSGDVLYGVYVGNNAVDDRRPTVYFNGKILNVTGVSTNISGWLYMYNNYIVAIYNPSNTTMTNKITHFGGSAGTLSTKKVNIPPGVIAFFNMSYCQPSGGSGSGSGSGSASSSSGLSNCYLTFKINADNDTKVTLDFTGANNFQATS